MVGLPSENSYEDRRGKGGKRLSKIMLDSGGSYIPTRAQIYGNYTRLVVPGPVD